MSVTISALKGVRFVFTSRQLFVGWLMFYLRYLWWFAYSDVQHILCRVFIMFVFVLCLVYPMLWVSLDCQFLISPSVFSSVYLFNGSNLTPSIESLYIVNKYDINIVTLCFILITNAPHPTQKSWFYLVTFIKAGSNTIRCSNILERKLDMSVDV